MNQLENPIEKDAVKLAWELLGIKGSKLIIEGEAGYPDRIFWLPGGRPFLVEVKRPGEDARPKQDDIHKKLKKLGYDVEVHDDAIDIIQAIIKRVEAARLPKESREILARARRRCTFLRSRTRKNIHQSGRNKDS